MKHKHFLKVEIDIEDTENKEMGLGSGSIAFKGNPKIIASVIVNALVEEQNEVLGELLLEINHQVVDRLKNRVGDLVPELEQMIRDEQIAQKLKNTNNNELN